MNFIGYGISGPIVLSCSSYICREDFSKIKLVIDLKPSLSLDVIENRIDREIIDLKNKSIADLLALMLPKTMITIFSKRLNLDLKQQANQLNK